MRCFYCNNDAEWYNPHEHAYYCKEHAIKKMNDYRNEFKFYDASTLKDWFFKIIKSDPELINVTLNTKTGEVSSNADNNWQ